MARRQIKLNGEKASLREVKEASTQSILRDFITASELKRDFMVSENTIKVWREAGKLSATKWRGQWYYSRADLPALFEDLATKI